MFAEAPTTPPQRRRAIMALSFLLHLLPMALLLHGHTVSIAPVAMPGTTRGTRMVLTYLPGHVPPVIAHVSRTRLPVRLHTPQHVSPAPLPVLSSAETAASHKDLGSGIDALGDGDVSIALMQFFPDPKPDLTRLPHGSRGDVVLEAIIDSAGRIAQLTVKQGIGYGVDESVIATVTQWTFHPAMHEGKPVASQQEFHFHYERG